MIEKALNLIRELNPVLVKANCFNAVSLFWQDTLKEECLGPEEFVAYVNARFFQVPLFVAGDIAIVWSRTASILPIGEILVSRLLKKEPGYPFGLVIEHAFVYLGDDSAFQKRDPSMAGPYEIVSYECALAPYAARDGYEITCHRRRSL